MAHAKMAHAKTAHAKTAHAKTKSGAKSGAKSGSQPGVENDKALGHLGLYHFCLYGFFHLSVVSYR